MMITGLYTYDIQLINLPHIKHDTNLFFIVIDFIQFVEYIIRYIISNNTESTKLRYI